MEANVKAQLAEKMTIVFGRGKRGGFDEFRLTHDNIKAYLWFYERYLLERKDNKDSPLLKTYGAIMDETDYLFTLKSKMWLLSLCNNERKDLDKILEQLDNEGFWKDLFNWRRMAKAVEDEEIKNKA